MWVRIPPQQPVINKETTMIICKIDDTGETFRSLAEIAATIGVSRQYVHQCKTYQADKPNHFRCGDYGITILHLHSQTSEAKYMRNYYKKKKERQ